MMPPPPETLDIRHLRKIRHCSKQNFYETACAATITKEQPEHKNEQAPSLIFMYLSWKQRKLPPLPLYS